MSPKKKTTSAAAQEDGSKMWMEMLAQQQQMMEKQEERHREQMQMMMEKQQRSEERMMRMMDEMKMTGRPGGVGSTAGVFDRMLKRIEKFIYNPDDDDKFDRWFKRYEPMLKKECEEMDEKEKVSLLVELLETVSHERFTRHILPKTLEDLSWEETIKAMTELFGSKKTLFRRRYEMLTSLKFYPGRDIDDFVNKLKANSMAAQLSKITKDELEVLFMVSAFDHPELTDYRIRFLNKLDLEEKLTVDGLRKEFLTYKSVEDDAHVVQMNNKESVIGAVRGQRNDYYQKKSGLRCYRCDGNHVVRDCPKIECFVCGGNHFKSDCPKMGDDAEAKKIDRRWDGHEERRFRAVIGSVDGSSREKMMINVKLGVNVEVTMQMDTGVEATLLSRESWIKMGRPELKRTATRLRDINGNAIQGYGQIEMKFSVLSENRWITGEGVAYVTDKYDIFGMPWIRQVPRINEALRSVCTVSTYREEPDVKQMSEEDAYHLFYDYCEGLLPEFDIDALLEIYPHFGGEDVVDG